MDNDGKAVENQTQEQVTEDGAPENAQDLTVFVQNLLDQMV